MHKLESIKTFIKFFIEDNYITSPSLIHKNKYKIDEEWLKPKIEELRIMGYTSINGLLNSEELIKINKKIESVIAGEIPQIDAKWNSTVKYWTIKNPLLLDSNLLKIALNLKCLAIMERYFQRKPYLADVDMRRIHPVDMETIQLNGYSSSNWHRDTRGRQLKMMIYLSDVDKNDSNFSFVPMSHTSNFRRKLNYMSSRLSDEEVDGMNVCPIEWYGKAGSIMIFDTNLIHRLRRKATSKIRDSVTFYYTPGQNTRSLVYHESDLINPSIAKDALQSPRWPLKRQD